MQVTIAGSGGWGTALAILLHENGHVHHDHQDILSAEPVLLNLIDDWINGGAKP